MRVRPIKETGGSTLTWVMIVSIVLTLLIAAILALVAYNSNSANLEQRNTQAYYTAQTVNERIVNWLSGTPSPESGLDPDADNFNTVKDPFHFIEDLMKQWPEPLVQKYSADDIGSNMGSATTTVEFTSAKFNEIKVTTSAQYPANSEGSGSSETLSTLLFLQKSSSFNPVNTDFDYNDPSIIAVMGELEDIPAWSAQASWAKQSSAQSNWWTYFANEYNDGFVDYKMDLLSINPEEYSASSAQLNHDFSYKYLQNSNYPSSTGKQELRIELNPTRGSFYVTQNSLTDISDAMIGSSTNPYLDSYNNYYFPYNDPSLTARSSKGVLLTINASDGSGQSSTVAHDKVIYYTQDHAGVTEDAWPQLTLGTYYSNGMEPPPSPLTYKNLSLYLTDTSEKTFEINSGINITSGTLYTKRSTKIGTVFKDTGNSNNNVMSAYSKATDLVFQSYNFIFANPGNDEEQRHSRISGTTDEGGSSKTHVSTGSILVQANHELTLGAGAVINAQDNKGIVLEPEASMVIEGGSVITGNIYIGKGAQLFINGNATITGNIFCSGTLEINSSFVLNSLDTNPDNRALGYVSSQNNNATGIFIYNSATMGVGKLVVSGNPVISSTTVPASNKIHSFIPYPQYASSLFCSHRSSGAYTHLCEQWSTNTYVWMPRSGSTQELRE